MLSHMLRSPELVTRTKEYLESDRFHGIDNSKMIDLRIPNSKSIIRKRTREIFRRSIAKYNKLALCNVERVIFHPSIGGDVIIAGGSVYRPLVNRYSSVPDAQSTTYPPELTFHPDKFSQDLGDVDIWMTEHRSDIVLDNLQHLWRRHNPETKIRGLWDIKYTHCDEAPEDYPFWCSKQSKVHYPTHVKSIFGIGPDIQIIGCDPGENNPLPKLVEDFDFFHTMPYIEKDQCYAMLDGRSYYITIPETSLLSISTNTMIFNPMTTRQPRLSRFLKAFSLGMTIDLNDKVTVGMFLETLGGDDLPLNLPATKDSVMSALSRFRNAEASSAFCMPHGHIVAYDNMRELLENLATKYKSVGK